MTRRYPPAVASSKTPENSAPIIRRRFLRASVELPAQYSVEGQPGWHTSIIDDLGGGGVRLQTQEDVAAGTVVLLRFDIEGTAVNATARIAMSLYDSARARFIHGVAFTVIDPQQQQMIVQRVVVLRGGDKE